MLRRVASLYSSARVLPFAAERCFRPLDARFAADVRLVLDERAVLAARLVPVARLGPEDARFAVEVFFAVDERAVPDERAAAVVDRLVLVVRFAFVRFALEARLVLDPLLALDAFAVRRPRPSAASWPVSPRRSFSLVRRRFFVFSFGDSYLEAPASCRAMAIACFGFFTLRFPAAVFSSPCLNSCITLWTVFFCAGL